MSTLTRIIFTEYYRKSAIGHDPMPIKYDTFKVPDGLLFRMRNINYYYYYSHPYNASGFVCSRFYLDLIN